jgi:hypothetical protein
MNKNKKFGIHNNYIVNKYILKNIELEEHHTTPKHSARIPGISAHKFPPFRSLWHQTTLALVTREKGAYEKHRASRKVQSTADVKVFGLKLTLNAN